MAQTKVNFILSVDSETGEYWHGERKLRTQEEINAVINQLNKKPEFPDIYFHRDHTSLQIAAMRILRIMGIFSRLKIVRFHE